MEGKDRIQVKLWVSRYCAEGFKRAVRDHYPSFQKGLISRQGEEALLRQTVHLRKLGMCEKVSFNTHAHAHNNQIDCPPKTLKLRDSIIEYLESKYGYDDLSKTYDTKARLVLLKHLKEAITYVKGTDERTIQKYLRELGHSHRLIKERGTGLFEFAPFEEELELEKENQRRKQKQIDDEFQTTVGNMGIQT